MKQVFRIFFGERETRPFYVLFCLLLAGIAEAASIGSLLPAITAMSGGAAASSSPLNEYVHRAFGAAGIEPSTGNLIVLVVVFVVLKAALAFAALSYAGISAARVSISLRRRLVAAIFDARWSFFADESGGRVANAISNDAGRAGDAYLVAAQVVAFSVQALAYAVVAFVIDWRLAFLGIAGGIAIAVVMGRLVRITRNAGYKQTDRTSALTIGMLDMLTNIKPLKSMQRHQATLDSIGKTLKRLKRALVTRELAKSGMAQGSDAVVAMLVGGGAYLAHHTLHTPLPELVVSGIVFFQIVTIASKMQKYLQQAVQYESAYVRTIELISRAEANRELNEGRQRPQLGTGCEFRGVHFAHGHTPVIADVSFKIPAGAITVFNGPSGAGKTTIIDLLIGLYRADKGRILVGGTPIDDIDIFAWRHMIGYVPQELNLFHASIRDNITMNDADIADADVLAALEQAGAGDFVASLPQGLDTDVGEMGGKLSGGQRQRISLARALVSKPKVLILDEVTSALDPKTEAGIVENIAGLRGAYTIIAITHREAWTKIADRLYRVAHGGVIPENARKAPARKKVRA